MTVFAMIVMNCTRLVGERLAMNMVCKAHAVWPCVFDQSGGAMCLE